MRSVIVAIQVTRLQLQKLWPARGKEAQVESFKRARRAYLVPRATAGPGSRPS
jgi:hypothetical protein